MLRADSHLISTLLELAYQGADLVEISKFVSKECRAERVFISYDDGAHVHIERYSAISQDPITAPVLSDMRSELSTSYLESLSTPLWVSDIERTRLPEGNLIALKQAGVRSTCLIDLRTSKQRFGWLELHFCSTFHRFIATEQLALLALRDALSAVLQQRIKIDSQQETQRQNQELAALEKLGEVEVLGAVSDVELLEAPKIDEAKIEETSSDIQAFARLLEFSSGLMIRTDSNFQITEINGDPQSFMGLEISEMMGKSFEVFENKLFERDLNKLQRRLPKLIRQPAEFVQKVRFYRSQRGLNPKDLKEQGEVRSLIVRGVPKYVLNKSQTFRVLSGWLILCLDVSEQQRIKRQLISQGKRIEALYEVSRAIQTSLEPSTVMFRALKALLAATSGECGLGFSYDSASEALSLVASHGLSDKYLSEIEAKVNQRSLVRSAVEMREAMLVPDIQQDLRAVVKMAHEEGLHGTIVTPLIVETRVVGAIVLFSRRVAHFSQEDFELTKAASNQIALAAQQAALYESERKQANSFAALYRLSHELARRSSVEEISEQAFSILNEELALRRIWLGVLSDKSKVLIGLSGFGPGLRGQLVKREIEIQGSDTALARAITSKRPEVVYPETREEISGLGRLFERLELSTYVIVPMVTLGQVVGVLVLEPIAAQGFFSPAKLSLLSSMANEIAVILLARRFEAKVAESDKMRMAGLLASGVAHNFNNILQALLGQASLIALQLPPHSPLQNSVSLMREAASKGADLVRQLLSYAQQGPQTILSISVAELLQQSLELYRSVLGSGIKLETNFGTDSGSLDLNFANLGRVKADYGQLQQVITNILINSREAIKRSDGRVKISVSKQLVMAVEIHPDLSPGQYLKIEIADNGIGMDSEQLSRCFEPFFTTKSVDVVTGIGISGSGLGLSSAYAIVRQHAGVITVESEIDKGSKFSIYLPLEQLSNPVQVSGSDIKKAESSLVTPPQVDRLGVELVSGEKVTVMDTNSKTFNSDEERERNGAAQLMTDIDNKGQGVFLSDVLNDLGAEKKATDIKRDENKP